MNQLSKIATLIGVTILNFPLTTLAQIIPASDGTGTVVMPTSQTPNSQTLDIGGGSRSADRANLFHSFEQFNLNTGETVNFISTPETQNIFTRVRGGNISQIDGMIRVTGSNANLFLMNPAGIIFGSNASLDIPASFFATTSTAIDIGNNINGFPSSRFDTFAPNNYSELVGSPSGFVFSGASGIIINQGNLRVRDGQNIGLAGNYVLNLGILDAPNGNVNTVIAPENSWVQIRQNGNLLNLEVPTQTILQNPGLPIVALPQILTGGTQEHATNIKVRENGTIELTNSENFNPALRRGRIASGTVEIYKDNDEVSFVPLLSGKTLFRQSLRVINISEFVLSRQSLFLTRSQNQSNKRTNIPEAESIAVEFPNLSARQYSNSRSELSKNRREVSPLVNSNFESEPFSLRQPRFSEFPNYSARQYSNSRSELSKNWSEISPLANFSFESEPFSLRQPRFSEFPNYSARQYSNSRSELSKNWSEISPLVNSNFESEPFSLRQPRFSEFPNYSARRYSNSRSELSKNRREVSPLVNSNFESEPFSLRQPRFSEFPNYSARQYSNSRSELSKNWSEISPLANFSFESEPFSLRQPRFSEFPNYSARQYSNSPSELSKNWSEISPLVNFSFESEPLSWRQPHPSDTANILEIRPFPVALLNNPEIRLSVQPEASLPRVPAIEERIPIGKTNSELITNYPVVQPPSSTNTQLPTAQILTEASIREIFSQIETQTKQKPAAIYAIAHPNQLTDKIEGVELQNFTSGLTLMLVLPDGKTIVKSIPDVELNKLHRIAKEFYMEVSDPRTTGWPAARQLYKWLIAPLEADLKEAGINTLLFYLDEELHSIPLAALYDGQNFLIENYNFSLIPSLSLTNANYERLENAEVLAMGMSEFVDKPTLPSVPTEVLTITEKLWSGEVLLNQSFTLENLQKKRSQQTFKIIHIATHANFSPENPPYIQLWDRKLPLKELRNLEWYKQPFLETCDYLHKSMIIYR
ncbi:MAG: CHAT domain-containing protein [Okeania sp. SIO3B5]|uniref:two-partner secretion domain-containing protein n=1 Tax=Okeania sp. SIO3B5 TaxID=2607811 RepID=UPI0014004E69|nr:CHAT domain-containing protein [Okeania sp. SIO3B5]NEO52375.1 CHAT domain-containing protein [Okeania sp. SIO3B5]